MTRFTDPRILTPPREEEEIYPYRPVWRSLFLESGILSIVVLVLFILKEILGISFPKDIAFIVNLGIVALPAILWLMLSRLPEDSVPEPRRKLLLVAVVSGLVASAIGYPLTKDFFQTEQWLPLATALQRILGFTVTFGIVDVGLKFIVIRYLVWPQQYRTRTDSIAYCVASSVGYSCVISLLFVSQTSANYSIVAIYVLSTYSIQLVSSLFLAYGFSESYFSNSIPLFLPFMTLVASGVIGLTLPLRSGLMNGGLTTSGNADRPIFGIGFAIAVMLIGFAISGFLFNVSERQEKETLTGREE